MSPTSDLSHLQPPGEAEEVVAERVLVLAPHFDDELIGCGGLLRQLAGCGAVVRVLFLTDGSGGVESEEQRRSTGEDPVSVRLAEAQAVAELGGWELVALDFADGTLARSVEALTRGVAEQLAGFEPDLVLVPSLLEVTPDHRAAFDALFEVLHPLRRDDEMYTVASNLRVLAYEVNHPAYPSLLVDVGEQMDWLESALGLYRSQLRLHDYSSAALGLRRYRTHSLSPEVEAAEGYTELRLDDFRTHSPSSLARHLGGPAESHRAAVSHRAAESVEISVVVRTYQRPELLTEALRSIAVGHRLPAEVIVVNDGGESPEEAVGETGLPLRWIHLEENRGRAAAANAGLQAATCPAVAFLDDDDLVLPEHFSVLADLISAAGVAVAYTDAAVTTWELRGSEERDRRDAGGWTRVRRSLPYSRDFDLERLLVDNYIPLHTLVVDRELALACGAFDEELESFEDWDFLIRLSRSTPFHHLRRVTCEYRHFVGSAHHALGTTEDASAGFLRGKARVLDRHRDRLSSEELAGIVTRMRREAVEIEQLNEELRTRWESDRLGRAEAEARSAEAQRQRWETETELRLANDRFHRCNGELESLRREEARLREELHRQGRELQSRWDQEERLRVELEERDQHLTRTYAEIERLNGLIEAMENTRAWRLHQLLQRRR